MQFAVILVIFGGRIILQEALKVILEPSLVVGLTSGVSSYGIHASEKIQRRLAQAVPRQLDVELLAGHLSKVILHVLDSTLAQKMQEGVTILVRKQRVASNLHQILECLPVKLGTSNMDRSDSIHVFGVRVWAAVLQHRLNDILISSKDSLIQRHLTPRVHAWLSLLEDVAQDRKILVSSSGQQIVEEVLLVEKDVDVKIMVSQQDSGRLHI